MFPARCSILVGQATWAWMSRLVTKLSSIEPTIRVMSSILPVGPVRVSTSSLHRQRRVPRQAPRGAARRVGGLLRPSHAAVGSVSGLFRQAGRGARFRHGILSRNGAPVASVWVRVGSASAHSNQLARHPSAKPSQGPGWPSTLARAMAHQADRGGGGARRRGCEQPVIAMRNGERAGPGPLTPRSGRVRCSDLCLRSIAIGINRETRRRPMRHRREATQSRQAKESSRQGRALRTRLR